MLPRRIYQFLIIYFLGLAVLLGVKYGLRLSNYVIPGPLLLWITFQSEALRYFRDVLDTMSIAIIGQILSICLAVLIGILGRQTTWFVLQCSLKAATAASMPSWVTRDCRSRMRCA